jgi:hypothetical protein
MRSKINAERVGCAELLTCGGAQLSDRYSSARGLDNRSIWRDDLLALFGRVRELLGISPRETLLRREALRAHAPRRPVKKEAAEYVRNRCFHCTCFRNRHALAAMWVTDRKEFDTVELRHARRLSKALSSLLARLRSVIGEIQHNVLSLVA